MPVLTYGALVWYGKSLQSTETVFHPKTGMPFYHGGVRVPPYLTSSSAPAEERGKDGLLQVLPYYPCPGHIHGASHTLLCPQMFCRAARLSPISATGPSSRVNWVKTYFEEISASLRTIQSTQKGLVPGVCLTEGLEQTDGLPG